jgi:hypothetical protein
VFSIGGESGAQTDNVGLQFIVIPEGADTLMPAGTQYADYATIHNYFCHPTLGGVIDNMTWHASDPVLRTVPGNGGGYDGLYGNYGKTWGKHFAGYSDDELRTLPRVTTETGIQVGAWPEVDEELHGHMLCNMYLSQFAQGYDYTAMYLLRDRSDEEGNQRFGFYDRDYNPRKAAHYLHNMTQILTQADTKPGQIPAGFTYSVGTNASNPKQPDTVHDLLLFSQDCAYLILWGERYTGGSDSIYLTLTPAPKHIAFYDITKGTEPYEIYSNPNGTLPAVFSEQLGSHAKILKLMF